jgi:hypothetical protein
MRTLRVVGLGTDGRTVILEPVTRRPGEAPEQFTLAVDESLSAAVRGELPRLEHNEVGMPHPMPPREIQARVRAGASVEQVASAAGVPIERIERFAYPVLLERSRMAQLAQRAHPVRRDGPDARTLEQAVGEALRQRGHDLASVMWDAWRGQDGKWVVQLRWRAGRSENRAHWAFHPGAHGGTVTALDDQAAHVVDPPAVTALRTVVAGHGRTSDGRAAPDESPACQPADPPAKRARKDRAAIPSWEDVLLGVRSPGS